MLRDATFAIRAFARTPGFTLVAVLTLALGIGATTVIFSVVNAVLLRPLPFPEPDRLVTARGSLADLRDLAASNASFQGVAFWASNLYNVRTDGDTRQVRGGQVSRTLLPLLGAEPVLGRNFTEEDDHRETVILSYGLWQSRFGGDPGVLGRAIDMSGTSYTVVGVAPAWFRFPSADFQLWTPLGLIDRTPQQATNRAFRIFSAVARLNPNTTLAQAHAEARAVSARLAREFPATNEGVNVELRPLYDRLVGDVRTPLTILLGTVALLLLIACANVASLMLARATSREREMAVRIALGAGRLRLVRQLITESLVLALAGGAAGLMFTMWGIDLLPAALEARLPRADGIRVDGAVLLFSLGATVLTGLVFGLAPALQTMRGPSDSLKARGPSGSGSASGRRIRRAIVIAETALAVVVLVGASLLVRSFLSLTARDPGFVPKDLLGFNVQLVKLPDDASRVQATSLLMDRLRTVPGVASAGAATGFPPVTPQRVTRFAVDDRQLNADEDSAFFIAATPDYFEALATPVIEGRSFTRQDSAGAAPVVVINRTLAGSLFPNHDAVGHRLKLINPERSAEWRTIVGVVGDLKYQGLAEDDQPTIYTPYAQTPFMWLYVMVRTQGSPGPLVPTIRAVVPSVSAALSTADIRPMTDVIAQSVAEPRFNTVLVTGFALLALILAGIGIYGVIGYSVAERTHEIGVRMALGAGSSNVMRLVLGEAIAVALAGIVLGLGGATLLSTLLSRMLFGITPRDPLAFASGAALLLTVAMLASYIPARRAVRVEPVRALRAE